MSEKQKNTAAESGGRRIRRRARGMLGTRTGKTIGFTSIAAPIIGFVVNDLKKPDSILRRLAGHAMTKLLPSKAEKHEAIDISDRVEILEDDTSQTNV